MPVLGLPLLLVGLAALPMVAGIYWLRTRFRRQEVSTLFLWRSAVDAQGGGRKKSRMQTPLALLLELLAILLLVLAATAPRMLRAGHTAVVTVVLDDSYSMTAVDGDGSDARQRAIEVLRDELNTLRRYRVRLITAGAQPEVLGEPATRWSEVESVLPGWTCEAATADLNAAIALATEVGGPRQRLLVLSDHAMPAAMRSAELAAEVAESEAESVEDDENVSVNDEELAAAWGRLRWISVGEPAANVALVNAVRSPDAARGDRVLLELANHGEDPAAAVVVLARGTSEMAYSTNENVLPVGEAEPISRTTIELRGRETRRVWLQPDAAGRPLVITLEDDALTADNRAVLMPAPVRPLPVAIDLQDPALSRAIVQALEASGRARVVSPSEALLTFTDVEPSDAGSTVGPEAGPNWTVRFDRGGGGADATQAYLGPFVIDYEHPLAEGLSLAGVVWAVGGEALEPEPGDTSAVHSAGGRPIVTAGNVVLLRDEARRDGTHRLTWRLRSEGSTWLESAAFPITVWNLVDWRQSERPGVSPVNARPGVPISIATNESRGKAVVTQVAADAEVDAVAAAEGVREVLPIDGRRATWVADRPGVYEILAEGRRHRVAVHAATAAESDLRLASAEAFGAWDDQTAVVNEYQGLAWVLGLLALGVLGLHAWLLFKSTPKNVAEPNGLIPGAA